MKPTRLVALTSLAMIAFAANSLLCRLALRRLTIDAASFSSIRIVSGAVALWLIVRLRPPIRTISGSWPSAFALFAYVAAFSFAYNSLPAATGALLLFAAVQSTMVLWGLYHREKFGLQQWCGLGIAIAGLLILVSPGLAAPPVHGSVLMLLAGIAWGIYSLRGKQSTDATSATAGNFFRAVPLAVLLSLAFVHSAKADPEGIVYAIASGAITSALGYVIWYAAVTGLTRTTAATVQLSAPVLAAIGGILFLGEPLTIRFLIAAVAVLGGIGLAVVSRRPRTVSVADGRERS
jgi:drug/metabolite transporter (DMT)-like permease